MEIIQLTKQIIYMKQKDCSREPVGTALEIIRKLTSTAPFPSPMSVTFVLSPPNKAIFSCKEKNKVREGGDKHFLYYCTHTPCSKAINSLEIIYCFGV